MATKTKPKYEKIAFVASEVPDAQLALERLVALYGSAPPGEADAIVALGGDGLMLQTLHRFINDPHPDLRHEPRLGGLSHERVSRRPPHRASAGSRRKPRPSLSMVAYDANGKASKALAITRSPCSASAIRPPSSDFDRRQGAYGGADLRRRSGRDTRGIDRLQSLGLRAHFCPSMRSCWH